jgi:hypothetical protein
MAEFLFVGSLALVFATLIVLFLFVLTVVGCATVERARTYFLIYKLNKTSHEMMKVSKRLEEATTVVLFDRVEAYRNGI